MAFRQRDVVKVTAMLPDGNEAVHPFVIISCNNANSREGHYTGVMMTGSASTNLFSFPVNDSMFESPLEKGNCQIRTHIFTSFKESSKTKLMTRMKRLPFEQLIAQITQYALMIDKD